MPKVSTPAAFAKTWTASFAATVRKVAGTDGRLTLAQVEKLAKDGDVFADNAVNYLKAVGQKSIDVDKLIAKAHDYALATSSKAAGKDGRLSLVDARSLPKDLLADFAALRGSGPSGGVDAEKRARLLRPLGEHFALSVFGEDDSGEVTEFVRRKKPVDALTPASFCKAFGFSFDKQNASDQFSFQKVDEDTWQTLLDGAYDDEGRAAVGVVKEAMKGLEAAVVLVEDDRPFGANIFFVARSEEGELFGFRGVVGGMTF